MDKNTAYRVLGLANGATADSVKAAYRAMAQKYSSASYAVSPMKEEGERKMQEVNEAFDTLMGDLRTGETTGSTQANTAGGNSDTSAAYANVRSALQNGNVDGAIAMLQTIENGANDARWNFLMGNAYYYKGWLQQATQYFTTATQLDPNNREYRQALNNMQNNAQYGNAGAANPYGSNRYQQRSGDDCGACDLCTMLMCFDCLCDGGPGRGCC